MTSNLFATPVRCLLLAGLAAGACHSGERAPIALEDLAVQVMHAPCNYWVACGEVPDATTCRGTFLPYTNFFSTIAQDVAAGRVLYDGHKARACLDLWAQIDECSVTSTTPLFEQLDSICPTMFVGTVPPGGACFLDEECSNGGSCEITDPGCLGSCCAGVCRARPPPSTVCTGPDQTCMPAVGEGAACSSATGCALPYFCKPSDTDMGPGICSRLAVRGEECSPNLGCDDLRDYCDPGSNTCVALPAVGQPCANGSCVPGASCVNFTCVARPRIREFCDPTVGQVCLGTLTCDGLTRSCVIPTVEPPCW
jgi:hypothetical protein